ncbi:MAG TPA: hypothetical protein DCY27_00160 [Desulfobacterales bacterium]|nr:hypothetical protein [Desulfobacterales bacterium]
MPVDLSDFILPNIKVYRGGILQFVLSVFITLTSLFIAIPGLAQPQATGQMLSLEEAINVALKNHPAIVEYKERSLAAKSQIGVSRANLFPQATHSTSYYYGNSVPSTGINLPSGGPAFASSSGVISDYVVHRNTVNQLLYDFGKTLGQIGQSKAQYEVSKMDLANTRQQVVLDAKNAFYGYLAAQRAVKVSEENVRLNEDLVRQAKGFYQVGVKAKIDVTTAEANLYNAQADLITARNTFQISQVSLMTALGLKSWPYAGLTFQLDTQPKLIDLNEAKDKAFSSRPEYLKNQFQQKADQEALRSAKAGYFPTLTSQGVQNTQGKAYGGMRDTWSVSVQMNFPLFEGLATTYAVRQAKASLRATESNTEVLRQDINKQVEQSYLDVGAAAERIRSTEKAKQAARENWDLAQGRYKAGVGSIIEVTDAQVKFFQAELNYIRSVYDLKTAEAGLERAIGKAY